MGFIYVGPKDDYGYNQAHSEGCAGVQKLTMGQSRGRSQRAGNHRRPGNHAQHDQPGRGEGAVSHFVWLLRSAHSESGQTISQRSVLPLRRALHRGKHPANVGSYFGYIDEAVYISGIVAGHSTKSDKLGFIAAKPIPQVLRNINAFALGARSVNPKATVQVIFTGDWSMPVKEAEAATSLIDQGVDVLTCHVDSPKVILETAERRGIYVCGYHANGASLAPKGYLTGAEWNWTKVYTDYAQMVKDGKTLAGGTIPHLIRGGLKEGFVKCSDYGPAVSDAAKKDAEAAKAKFMDGSMIIFKGPLKDNTGKEILPEGKEYKQQDIELEKMSWLVEGVIGST